MGYSLKDFMYMDYKEKSNEIIIQARQQYRVKFYTEIQKAESLILKKINTENEKKES
jgi:hypothetical protein